MSRERVLTSGILLDLVGTDTLPILGLRRRVDTHGCGQSRRVVLLATLAATLAQSPADALGAESPPNGTFSSTCPDPLVVWGIVLEMMPSAATEFRAAPSRVTFEDLGDDYQVRVRLGGTTLERRYTDAAHDCDRRARFAAEFVVIALSPPSLNPEVESPPTAAPAPSAPATIATFPATLPHAPVPTQRGVPSAGPSAVPSIGPVPKSPVLRLEVAATVDAAPRVLGAPSILSWGASLRIRVGRGPLSAIAGVGYSPNAGFAVGDFRGAVTRIPVVLGARALFPMRWVEVDADMGGAAALERYEGLSPQKSNNALRLAVGVEAGIVASVRGFARVRPLAAFRFGFYPATRDLATAPQGIIGKTPSVWIGAALGMSFDP